MSIEIPLLAAGLAALALPLAASAQNRGYWNEGYAGGGDYHRGWGGGYGFSGYPQFQGEKQRARVSPKAGSIATRGGNFYRQLRFVQVREQREFREHGWSLPGRDAQSIRGSLDQLDRAIHQQRDQGGDGGGCGYR